MERWLANISKLRRKTPADFLMVDNSPGLDYADKIKGYCQKLDIRDYKIKHLELTAGQGKHERVTRSWEEIRQYVLAHNYDAWFTWECDQLIPPNALDILIKQMKVGGYQLVHANTWAREMQEELNPNFGCALIARESLRKYGFLDKQNMNTESPNPWDSAEVLFKRRVLAGGGKYIELFGLIHPIYHLDKT